MNGLQLKDLVDQICQTWNIDTPVVKIFNNIPELGSTAAVALYPSKYRNLTQSILLMNKWALDNTEFEFIYNVILHELAHIYLEKSDNDIMFQFFCRINGIWLNQNEDNLWNGKPEELQAKYEYYEEAE